MTLSWSAATDNIAVTGYNIYKNGILYCSTTGTTTLSITGLTCITNYSMAIKSKDASGNINASSNPYQLLDRIVQ